MKIKLLSDLHLEFYTSLDREFNPGQGEVLILAGDILCLKHLKKDGDSNFIYRRFLNRCSENYDKVFYILGNHEIYGERLDLAANQIREYLPPNISLLENEFEIYRNYKFIGATFWTSFFNRNPNEMIWAGMYLNDFKTIKISENYRKIIPEDLIQIHEKSFNFIQNAIQGEENVIIITHHSPSLQSISEQYKTSPNGAYANDLDKFILNNSQIKGWCHGHMHSSFDYMIGNCRVICNPSGYWPNNLNSDFNLNFEIEV